LIDDLWRNHHRGDVNPIHVRLRRERARDFHVGEDPVVDQNIDYAGFAVYKRPRAVDLLTRNESTFFEDFEHVLFVVLHLGRMLEPAQFTAKPLNFQQGKSDGLREVPTSTISFHGHAFGEIAWFIDVATELDSEMIGEKLKRDDSQDRHYVLRRFR